MGSNSVNEARLWESGDIQVIEIERAPIIIDIEASGFGVGSYPIEVGVAMPDGTLYDWLIEPAPHWTHWQTEAESIHGISREMLLQEGLPMADVANELNELLHNETAFSDGWGVDRAWLALLFHDAGIYQGFKIDSVYALLNEVQLDSWGEYRQAVLDDSGHVPHRAGIDAGITQKTFLHAKHVERQSR